MLKIENRPLSKLVPYANNARTHAADQIDQIAASISEFGFVNPVLIGADDVIIAGHGRVLAAEKLGLAEVPVIVLSHLSEMQRHALVIADNRIAENAGWDDAMLRAEIAALQSTDFDIGLLGFNDIEILSLLSPLGAGGLTDPDEEQEPPVFPCSALGDVWLLGRHRIVCGDSTDAGAVAKALNGVKPHLMVTDPPYGVEYDANWRNKSLRKDGTPNGGRAIGVVKNDDRADWSEAWALFPGDVAYVWHGGLHAHAVADSLLGSGFGLRAQIIWIKSNFAIGRGDYHWQHEPCWYAVRVKATGNWAGDRKQTTVWQIAKPAKSETGHSTQKPVECMARPIRNNSSPGQAVYEPFSGSGTTIIACEQEGRTCHAIELMPAYVDVAVTRWERFAGQQATLEETGESFSQVLARRHVKMEADKAVA